MNFAEKHLGPEDGITQNLRSVYENAKNELDMALFKKGKKTGEDFTFSQGRCGIVGTSVAKDCMKCPSLQS